MVIDWCIIRVTKGDKAKEIKTMIKITSFDKDGNHIETTKVKQCEPVKYFKDNKNANSIRVQFEGHKSHSFYRCDFKCCGVV